MRICPRCEAKTDESGTFCPDCGTSFLAQAHAMSALSQSAIATMPRATSVDPTAATGSLVAGVPPTIEIRDGEPVVPAGAPSAAITAATSLVGYTIDHQFVVETELGGGAFGTVYRGRQLGLDRVVAIKVPTHQIAADPVMAKRFAREARSAGKIQHPGVIAIYAVGELPDGRPYLVMQFVEGKPLDKILEDGPLSATRALRIIRAVASALSETHAAGVVHRDLKPSNIMWQRDRNGDDRLTIIDFGIAASKPGTADASRLTANGLIGTPHYMSPEQAHGEAVDARADLYALGCLLFELVTNAPPFEGSAFEVLLAHLGKVAPVPSSRDDRVPEVIDGLCAALLAKKPDDRPQTADEVVTLVDVALAELASQSAVDSYKSGERPARDTAKGGVKVNDKTARKSRRKKRATALTRPDLPDDYLAEVAGAVRPRPRHTMRQLGIGALAGVALATAGFFVAHGHLGASVEDATEDEPEKTVDGTAPRLHQINGDDGEIVIHVEVPDPIVANVLVHPHIEIKNKLGQAIKTSELVVTVVSDTGATGLVAHPRARGPGYAFRYTFPHAGRYTLKVFPPSVASAFEIPLDVR
ncbi:MAG: protein kinase [Deltaproteobacteria bacterium]